MTSVAQSKRWARVSGSRNADKNYREQCQWLTPDELYAYVCWCSPPWQTADSTWSELRDDVYYPKSRDFESDTDEESEHSFWDDEDESEEEELDESDDGDEIEYEELDEGDDEDETGDEELDESDPEEIEGSEGDTDEIEGNEASMDEHRIRDDGWSTYGEDEYDSGLSVDEMPVASARASSPKCDRGKTCVCGKSPRDYPNHRWITTRAGKLKYKTQVNMVLLRRFKKFGMKCWSEDKEAEAFIEVLENLVLDFDEAEGNWRERWAICEAMIFLLHQRFGFMKVLTSYYDGEHFDQIVFLVARTFLTMLVNLLVLGLFKLDFTRPSRRTVENVELIVYLYIKLAADLWTNQSTFMEYEYENRAHTEPEFYKRENPVQVWPGIQLWFCISEFDSLLLGWTMVRYTEHLNLDRFPDMRFILPRLYDLEVPSSTIPFLEPHNDPYDFKGGLERYVEAYGHRQRRGKKMVKVIGGDRFDITAWGPSQRKKHDNLSKEPMSREQLDMLKRGLVVWKA